MAYQFKSFIYLSAGEGLIHDMLFLREVLVWPQQARTTDITSNIAKADRQMS